MILNLSGVCTVKYKYYKLESNECPNATGVRVLQHHDLLLKKRQIKNFNFNSRIFLLCSAIIICVIIDFSYMLKITWQLFVTVE